MPASLEIRTPTPHIAKVEPDRRPGRHGAGGVWLLAVQRRGLLVSNLTPHPPAPGPIIFAPRTGMAFFATAPHPPTRARPGSVAANSWRAFLRPFSRLYCLASRADPTPNQQMLGLGRHLVLQQSKEGATTARANRPPGISYAKWHRLPDPPRGSEPCVRLAADLAGQSELRRPCRSSDPNPL